MKAIELLNNRKLKRTSCREGIIEVMMTAEQALSENEIRERLMSNYDRTTFYRSFKTLEEHKIIHKITVDNQMVKYALDQSVTHKKDHAHFFCNECKSLQCLTSTPLSKIRLPKGYEQDETVVIVKGVCAVCKNKTYDKL